MMRTHLLRLLTILISCIFFIKLFSLQVLDKDYDKLSQNNAIIEIEDYPERGFIFDRKGRILVSNQPAYDVMIIPENVSPFDTLSFCKLTGINKKDLILNLESARKYSEDYLQLLLIKYQRNPTLSFKNKCGSLKDFLFKKSQ